MAKGMNPELASKDMDKMIAIKKELEKLSKEAANQINSNLSKAFYGSQVETMKKYTLKLNSILNELFSYIDGKGDSSFSTVLNKTIASYKKSDANVASSYKV